MELTKSESNILEILLDANKPLSKSEILNHALENKPWKDGSIHILLNSLLKKGAIYEAGFIRTGKVTHLSADYSPKTVKRKIASLKALFHHLEYKEILLHNPFAKLQLRFREPIILLKTIL